MKSFQLSSLPFAADADPLYTAGSRSGLHITVDYLDLFRYQKHIKTLQTGLKIRPAPTPEMYQLDETVYVNFIQ
jgi:hypothetical protein